MTEKMIIRRCDIHTAWTNANMVSIFTEKGTLISVACVNELAANEIIKKIETQGGHESFSFIIEAENIRVNIG